MKNYIEYNNKVTQKNDLGFYQLENDKEAIRLFKKEIEEKTLQFNSKIEKMEYLIREKYYVDFFKLYDLEEIENFIEYIYGFKFEFQSFMAISKFYQSYVLKTNDKKYYLETYEDRIICLSLFLAEGDIKLAFELGKGLITQQYQPATPTFANGGLYNSGELISCFLLEFDDSLNSIAYNVSTSMQLSKIGGGVALNLSKLRARGESVKEIDGVAKGVIPILKLLEDTFSYVDQLGKRPGAGAAYLNIFHADVVEFLDTKKINADEKSRIQNLSLGLVVPDKFMELARDNKEMALFYPYNVKKEYGIHLDEMDLNEMYDELEKNPNIKKKYMKARELLQLISLTQFESGYPYLVYVDNANDQNPLKDLGRIKMSNLCTEIFQIQTTSNITDYYEKDNIGYDINCNLGSLNITNVMENKEFEETIKTAMNALTSVSNKSHIENAPGVQKANDAYHSVGLGVMNLHGYLSKNRIAYESADSLEFVRIFFMMLNYYSLKASNEIAIDKKETFKDFEKSEYKKGTYFDQYLDYNFEIGSDKIKKLFEGIYIPTKKDWEILKENVKKHGLYHSYRLAIAPTQSISYIQNATASIQPIVSQVETRVYGNSTTYYPMPYMQMDNVLYYKSAYNMDQLKIIDLVSEMQKHIDQGISMVLFVTNENTTRDLARYYYYAWKKGLKSIYYIRTMNLSIEECESCSV